MVIFDVEGTIFDLHPPAGAFGHGHLRSVWLRCAQALGEEALASDAELARAWDRSEDRSYIRWCRSAVDALKRHGMTRPAFDAIIAGIPFFPGVGETISMLRESDVEVIFISGGIHALTLRAAAAFEVDICYSGADFRFDAGGNLCGAVFFPSDYEGKVRYLDSALADLDIELEHACFVGDGSNDIPIARHAGYSIGFRPASDLAQVADCAVTDYRELRGVLRKWLARTRIKG